MSTYSCLKSSPGNSHIILFLFEHYINFAKASQVSPCVQLNLEQSCMKIYLSYICHSQIVQKEGRLDLLKRHNNVEQ